MALPYENSTAGDKAIGDMQKILRGFGCQKFGYMLDDVEGSLLVQFEYRGRQVSVKASMQGYATAWLKEHPYSTRMRKTKAQHEAEVLDIAGVALTNILERAIDRKRWGCTGDELHVLELLMDFSLDYWNRRSGALYYDAYQRLKAIRVEQARKIREAA